MIFENTDIVNETEASLRVHSLGGKRGGERREGEERRGEEIY